MSRVSEESSSCGVEDLEELGQRPLIFEESKLVESYGGLKLNTYKKEKSFRVPVLIVDDNSLNMVAIQNNLLQLGIDSESASNGQ